MRPLSCDFLTQDLLGQASPEKNPRSEQITVEQLLDLASDELEQNATLANQPEAKAADSGDVG